MPGSPTARLKAWLSAVFIILAAILLLFSWLPVLAEKFVLPEILPPDALADYQVSVYRFGLSGCTLKISGRPETNPIISTGNIQIYWSLSGLKDRRLDLLILDGLQMRISNKAQGKISSPLSSSARTADTMRQDRKGSGGSRLPLLIEEIRVFNSTITFDHQNLDHTLSFSLVGQRIGRENLQEKNDTLHYKVRISTAAQEMEGELAYKHQNQILSGNIRTNIDLHRLSREIRNFAASPLGMKGIAGITLHVEAKLVPFSLQQLQAEVRLEDVLVQNREVVIRSNGDEPALFSLSGSQERLMAEATGLVVESPLQATTHFDALISFPNKAIKWQGSLRIQPVAGQDVAQQYILSQAPPIVLHHEGIYQDNEVRLNIVSLHKDDIQTEPFAVEHNDIRIKAGRLEIESGWQYTPKNETSRLNGTLLLKGYDLAVGSPGVLLQFPRLQLDGKGVFGSPDIRTGFSVSGGLKAPDASLNLDRQELRLHGMQLQFPVSWPLMQEQQEGVFKIDSISLRAVDLGSLNAALHQRSDKIEINGKLASNIIPDGLIAFNGILHFPDKINSFGGVTFFAENTRISPENFSPLFPVMDSFSGSGQLNMNGQVTLYRDRTAGFLSLDLHDGNLDIPKFQTSAEGINFTVDFPDFPALHTSPEQKFSINRITGKKLLVTDIKSSFRLESPDSLFVEKISAGWSGGRLFSGSFRLQKEKPGFEVALLCDRLDLAGVLTQLGLARAEGNGKVSGRIPLLYEKGNLYVDNGFLFSTPGETGTLKIIKSEHLTAGIPQDVPHFSPIHFAGAALRDFQYNWAKLLVSSQEENLQLQLQIDGKPAERMPYRFDTKQNVFVRLAEGEAGGIDQPVKLDVNFNIPLNELLRYYKQIQPILRNIR